MAKFRIRRVEFKRYSQLNDRRIMVAFSDGQVAYIVPCSESWEIYNCDLEHKQMAMPIAEKFNYYLHGEDL